MTGTVRLERRDDLPGVAVVTIANAGKLNAMSMAMWRELRAVFDLVPRCDPELRAIVVRGADGAFVSGGDIEEFPDFRFSPAGVRDFHEGVVAPALEAMWLCDLPIVAQIERACVGGGLEIASVCDIRIAGVSARFGAPIARLGFPMAIDELAHVLRLVGPATVAEMLLESRMLDAETAMMRGLIHRLVPDAAVADEAFATAARIAAGAPMAARLNKRALRLLTSGNPITESDRASLASYASSRDHREGIEAYLQKRSPIFEGR